MTALFPAATTLPTLLTERLAIRWLEPADAPALYAVLGDPVVMRYWSTPPLASEQDARDFIAGIHKRFAARDLFQWGIACRDDDRVIGTCTLYRVSLEHRRGEIGYALGAAHWGRGYAAEALSALVAFAFDSLDLHRLEADVDPRNERSLRLLEGMGFVREGLLRERYHVNGEVQDTCMLGLLAPEWAERAEGVARDAGRSWGALAR
jgi:[ribosomal protein S5]-alanine N-acetyltransferase